ncbi:hypothetical protein DNTS_032955, partial [Danionella cerebrum]
MERGLLRQAVFYHGETLLNLLKCEHNENPDFRGVFDDLPHAEPQRVEEESSPILEQFISQACAVMPPLEQFMEVSFDERRELFFRDVEPGDLVIGKVNSVREYGLFVTLLCAAGALERDIQDLEIKALCPVRHVPSTGNHDDPLSYYQVGDLIRAGVKSVERYQEKLTISLRSSALPSELQEVKLGVITKEDLPLHHTTETYEKLLEHSLGICNPLNVDYLMAKLGISDTQTPSLMRGLQSHCFREEDFAITIRKKQSASWALNVKAGVAHFKSGHHVEAMNEYNKALEIDINNVEALVARGALYATKGGLVKAISDFELALETCPTHRNAKKYFCQTLVERGRQLEREEKLVTAEGLYRKALTIDDMHQEAKEALEKLNIRIQKSLKLKELEAAKEQEKANSTETSAEKLRKILKEEKRMKKKRKSSTSSSSSSSSDLSSSSDDGHSSRKKSKKRKHKHRRSSRGSKKRRRRDSASSNKMGKDNDDWFPAPAITSASFINQKQSINKLLSYEEPTQSKKQEDSNGETSRSKRAVEDSDDESSRSKSRNSGSYGEPVKRNIRSESVGEPDRRESISDDGGGELAKIRNRQEGRFEEPIGGPSHKIRFETSFDGNGDFRERRWVKSTSENAKNRRDSSSSNQSESSYKADPHWKEPSFSRARNLSESEQGRNEKRDGMERGVRNQSDGGK